MGRWMDLMLLGGGSDRRGEREGGREGGVDRACGCGVWSSGRMRKRG